MEKRSPRSPAILPKSPLIYEKYKTGCAWSLLGFFDFRQGHSSKKLVSDKRCVNRHPVGNDYTKNKVNSLGEFDEKCQQSDDIVDSTNARANSAVAKGNSIMKEEMSCKLQKKKKVPAAKLQHVQSDSEFVDELSKKHRRKSRKFKKPRKNLATRSSNKLNTTTAEAFCNQRHLKSGRDDSCKSVCCTMNDPHIEMNLQVHMDEATEAFINQKFVDGKHGLRDGASDQSKHFLDALEILNSNKELFIKLLQDPNSLLVKHIQDLRYSQATSLQNESSFGANLENQMSNRARELSEEAVLSQTYNSYDEYLSRGSDGFQHPDTIVLMKPRSAMQDDVDRISYSSSQQSKGKSGKPATFSLKNMKNKLKHAIGINHEEFYNTSTNATRHKSFYDFHSQSCKDRTGIGRETVSTNSSNRTYLDARVMAKSSDDIKKRGKMSGAKNLESGIRQAPASARLSAQNFSNSSIFRHPKEIESKFYLESQRHLSKKADIASHRSDIFSRQLTETMQRTTVFPEYDFLPPLTPGMDRVHTFLNAEMRFSPYNYYPKVNWKNYRLRKEKLNGCINLLKENFDAQTDNTKLDYLSKTLDEEPGISENHFPDTEMQEKICFLGDDSTPRGPVKIMETNNTVNGEVNPLEVPCEPHCSPDTNNDQNMQGATIYSKENGGFESPNMDSPLESCTSPSTIDTFSSSPVRTPRVDNSPGVKDGSELPSPFSVLERIYMEDIANPKNILAQTAKQPIHPDQINVDKHNSTAFVTLPMHLKVRTGSASEYIKSVLQVSSLNWDEFIIKYHSSGQLLDPSLFNDLEVCPGQSCFDHKLLFDYINEVLLEVYQRNLTYPLCISLVKRKLLPVILMNDVVHDAMKCVNWFLLSKLPPQTLEQLVGNDLTKSATWMDVHINVDDVLADLVDGVLEELIMESAIEL
ncbi:uncharacterized protein LOC110812791 [Carica papaya]|uniref:uncharacterized protein LOC110812791 n=1 Tax=Carica papaya TaxID=3649 RepID=UPI000B8C76F2|nr:uncharacterized protein LOC110812791 [Carica papaya]XP_021895328.1 uncharacterized protein LOC110812791 [Carica papaya]XP_021895329.1 uncharacterized protein LOC110812791 [Carica papaya]